MFSAHVMVSAMIAAFEQRPKALNAVRVRVAVNIDAFRVIDNRVLKSAQAVIANPTVAINNRIACDRFIDDGLQLRAANCLHYLRAGFSIAAPHTEYWRLSCAASAFVLTFGGVLVFLQSSQITFV